jgi:hypothetical protein
MSIVLQSSGGGSVTINEPATASNFTQTLPAATGDVMVSGNMPAFRSSQSGAQTGITNNSNVKILFQTESFDTNNNFDSSRFTATVAGYYQINSIVQCVLGASINSATYISIWKNGSEYSRGTRVYSTAASTTFGCAVCDVIYLNGSTDYVEIYGFSNSGTWATESTLSYFSGSLVRSA